MSAHVPALPLEADPLVAEARRRARRRRLVVAAIVILVAAAAGTTFAFRSSGGAVGLCATPASGWKERSFPKTSTTAATVVLTNFRFGQMESFFGLTSSLRWPRDGVMIAVSNEGPNATPPLRPVLRVAGRDFSGFEGMSWPAAHVAIRSHDRVLDAYVEARRITPATVAAANAAHAGVRTCSA